MYDFFCVVIYQAIEYWTALINSHPGLPLLYAFLGGHVPEDSGTQYMYSTYSILEHGWLILMPSFS